MSLNLLDSVRGAFTTDLTRKAALFLGEPETTVRNALDAVIPVTLAGIVNKAETGGVDSLLNLANDAYQQRRFGSLAEHFATGGEGVPSGAPALIKDLFGDRFGSIANAVTSFTGSKGATISSLFGSVVPFVLALLGRYVRDNNVSPGALSSLLGSQKSAILAALPAGLNLAGFPGAPARPAATFATAQPEVRGGNRWLMPVLALLLAGGVFWWLTRDRTPDGAARVAGLDTAPRPVSAPVTAVSRDPIQVTLPNGVTLDAYRGGIEDRLVAFLKDTGARPSDDLWFDFHDLNFEFGTARIVPESRGEVNNIVQILKAFPAARIKLGGYTDAVGDPAANQQLSQDRADAVRQELVSAGVGAQVTGAEGYGSEFAQFPATAPEGDRIKDRRVAVSVRAK